MNFPRNVPVFHDDSSYVKAPSKQKLPVLQVVLRDELLTGPTVETGYYGQVVEVLKDGEPVGCLPVREARLLVRPCKFGVLSLDIDAAAVVEGVKP